MKPLIGNFHKEKRSKDGYRSICSTCCNKRQPRVGTSKLEVKPLVVKDPIWRSDKELAARERAVEAIF